MYERNSWKNGRQYGFVIVGTVGVVVLSRCIRSRRELLNNRRTCKEIDVVLKMMWNSICWTWDDRKMSYREPCREPWVTEEQNIVLTLHPCFGYHRSIPILQADLWSLEALELDTAMLSSRKLSLRLEDILTRKTSFKVKLKALNHN